VLHLRDGILGARVIWKRAPGVPDRANPHNLLPNCLDRCSFCAPCLSSCAARDYFWVVTRRVRRAPDRRASLAVPHDHHAILNVIPTGEHLSGVSVRRRSGLRLNSLWVRRDFYFWGRGGRGRNRLGEIIQPSPFQTCVPAQLKRTFSKRTRYRKQRAIIMSQSSTPSTSNWPRI
jgi:hypothetical protein